LNRAKSNSIPSISISPLPTACVRSRKSCQIPAAQREAKESFCRPNQLLLPCQRIHHVRHEPPEGFVLDELLVNLGVVLQQGEHDLGKGLVVLDVGGVGRILLGVLVGRIGGDLRSDIVLDPPGDPVRVGEERAEMVVEGFEDVAQAVSSARAYRRPRLTG
jgi:hypothetical protein